VSLGWALYHVLLVIGAYFFGKAAANELRASRGPTRRTGSSGAIRLESAGHSGNCPTFYVAEGNAHPFMYCPYCGVFMWREGVEAAEEVAG